MKWFLCICSMIVSTFCYGQLERRETTQPMTISIIIPCHYAHFKCLPELLTYYSAQEVKPDEVVISITASQKPLIPAALMDYVLHEPFPFSVRVVEDSHELPGENRNAACRASIGDILVCQDADDLPHPDRLKFIKHLFETYKVDFLIHRFYLNEGSFLPYTMEELEKVSDYFEDFQKVINYEYIHNGNIAITRQVFNEVNWPHTYNGEDINFNERVFKNKKFRKVFTHAYLLLYRVYLSSYKVREGLL